MTVKTVVIISDTQMPYEDTRAMRSVINFIGTSKPDEVIHIGDLMDYPSPSRWTKGTAGEFQDNIDKHSEYAIRHFFEPLRRVYDGPVGIHEGNHDLRPRAYLDKYAPALVGTEAADGFRFENLLRFDDFGISVLPQTYEVAPGWITTHGHKEGISISQIAGKTAANAAESMQKSVIMGHTHRRGVISKAFGHGGKVHREVTGVEVGNLMDMRKAQYLDGGTANWQQGFGVAEIDGNAATVYTVPIRGKKFIVHGKTYHV